MSPKTPSYTAKEIIRLLEMKGFVFDRASGSHQIYMLPDGSKRVIIPLHKKD
jgi:predicted RNA binding protein YcfA (HicA-like mRNA interferase family)